MNAGTSIHVLFILFGRFADIVRQTLAALFASFAIRRYAPGAVAGFVVIAAAAATATAAVAAAAAAVVVVSNLYSHDSQWPIRDNSVREEKE